MCLNKECVYVTIGVDEFGDRYITHYKFNEKETDLVILFKEFIESQKPKKLIKNKTLKRRKNKSLKQHQNYHYCY